MHSTYKQYLVLSWVILSISVLGCRKSNDDLQGELVRLRSALKKTSSGLTHSSQRVFSLEEASRHLYKATEEEKKLLSFVGRAVRAREQRLDKVEQSMTRLVTHWQRLKKKMDELSDLFAAAQLAYQKAGKQWNLAGKNFQKTAQIYKEITIVLKTVKFVIENMEGLEYIGQLLQKPDGLQKLLKTGADELSKQAKEEIKGALKHHAKNVAKELACQIIPIEQFQRMLEQKGLRFQGKKIIHIIPKSQGGADLPENYRLATDKEENASHFFANCVAGGSVACGKALLASTKCGDLRGESYISSLISPESFQNEMKEIFRNASKQTLNEILAKANRQKL